MQLYQTTSLLVYRNGDGSSSHRRLHEIMLTLGTTTDTRTMRTSNNCHPLHSATSKAF